MVMTRSWLVVFDRDSMVYMSPETSFGDTAKLVVFPGYRHPGTLALGPRRRFLDETSSASLLMQRGGEPMLGVIRQPLRSIQNRGRG